MLTRNVQVTGTLSKGAGSFKIDDPVDPANKYLSHTKVSWQVAGIRHDAYAEAHRIPVEEAKVGAERGRYLHPELSGQARSQGIAAGG